MYLWKVRLNPVTHDPDGTTLVCISFSVNFYYSYITSLRPKLEANGDLHLTYADSRGEELWYFIFNWTSGSQSASRIYNIFYGQFYLEKLQAVFIGKDRQLINNDLNRYQGYFGASKRDFNCLIGCSSTNRLAPGIWPILDKETCEKFNTNSRSNSFSATNAYITVRSQSWRANTLAGKAVAIQALNSKDISQTILYETNSWC